MIKGLKNIVNEIRNRTAFTQIWVIDGYYNTENKRMIEVRKWFGYLLVSFVTFEENLADPLSSKSIFCEANPANPLLFKSIFSKKAREGVIFKVVQTFPAGIQLDAIELYVRQKYGEAARVVRKKVKQKEWKIPADVKENTHNFVNDLFEKMRMEREMKRGGDSDSGDRRCTDADFRYRDVPAFEKGREW